MTSSKNEHSVDIYTKNDGNFTIQWQEKLNCSSNFKDFFGWCAWMESLEGVSGRGLILLERAKFHCDLFVL